MSESGQRQQGSGEGGRGARLARGAADIALAAWFAWCVLVPLLAGGPVEASWGGLAVRAGITSRNLLVLWLLLGWRTLAARRAGRVSWVGRLFAVERPLAEAVGLGALVFVVYLAIAQPRAWPSGDTIPVKLAPISLLEEGNADLDEFVAGVPAVRRYGFHRRGVHWVSAYPLATAWTALPVYAAARWLAPGAFASWRLAYALPDGDDLPNVANLLEQIAAALLTALTVVVIWRFARRVGRRRGAALAIALAAAFGTPLASTAALALWQHTTASLFLALAVLLLSRGAGGAPAGAATERSRPWTLVAAGLCAGWAVACRPAVFPMAGVLLGWALLRLRGASWRFVLPALAAGAVTPVANLLSAGSAAGGYRGNLALFDAFHPEALPTLLLSPSRGLFVFSPFLLAALWLCPDPSGLCPDPSGLRSDPSEGAWRRARGEPLGLPTALLAAAASEWLLFAFWKTWAAGASFGPRYLCEAAVLLAMVCAWTVPTLAARRGTRAVLTAAIVFSCQVHLVGAARGDGGWTDRVFAGERAGPLWALRDSQLAWTLLGGRAER